MTNISLARRPVLSGRSSGAAVQRVIEKIAQLKKPCHAPSVISVTASNALLQAETVDYRQATGLSPRPLEGMCVGWKDIIDQEGEVTTLGSALRKDAECATDDAPIVRKMEQAGAISLARTNLSELAFSGLGINPHFGTPPSALSQGIPLLPGGSSSGSAVLVAKGIVDIGMGTDTSGSVRVPAALNGIYGFRPSTARYCRKGVHALSETLDTVGVLANSVERIIATDAVLADVRGAPVSSGQHELLDVSDALGPHWQKEVFTPYRHALDTARRNGWTVRRFRLRAAQEIRSLLQARGPLVAIEARRRYEALATGPEASRLDPLVRRRIVEAPVLSDRDYQQYLSRRAELVGAVREEIGDALIAHPTVPALRLPFDRTRDSNATARLNTDILAATMIGSLLDLPGLAIPLTGNRGRIESSLLLSAASGCDGALLVQGSRLAALLSNQLKTNDGE
ncbi:amidase family protein [Roseibium sp. SCP14]|uniref:amidase family protein n=1 Tax=Roseibium sp. SCP14 TaxID=3141375 RepID=UPI003334C2B9